MTAFVVVETFPKRNNCVGWSSAYEPSIIDVSHMT